MADNMLYRSTNVFGYTHFQGDVVSGVADANGVQLGTASTGADPNIDAVGDAANIGLRVRQKGTGTLRLGSTDSGAEVQIRASTIFLGSSGSVVQINSTAPWAGSFRVNVANCTTFNFASTDAGKTGETTVAIVGVNSSHFITANQLTAPTGVTLVQAYPVASTVGSVHLVWSNGSSVTVGNSTANVRFNIVRY